MRLIVNADDFGRSSAVNEAVLRAHRQGVLTSASLMVAGDAFEEAVDIARRTPTLAVGLHVVVAAGRAVLPPARIARLVDPSGRFRDERPTVAGLRYALRPGASRELALELRAQFERFARTGLPLSHVDGHLHLHMHPAVFALLVPLARRYGARGFRLPRDDSGPPRPLAPWLGGARALNLLSGLHERTLRREGLATARRVYGLLRSGGMHEPHVVRLLQRIDAPTAELYLHPSMTFEGDELGPNPGDLAALLSPRVRRTLDERRFSLATYPSIAAG